MEGETSYSGGCRVSTSEKIQLVCTELVDSGRGSIVGPGESDGRATGNLLAGRRRCEFDVGDDGSCQGGQRRQDMAAHCLCVVCCVFVDARS